MIKIIPTTVLALIVFSGMFMAFSDSTESDFLVQLKTSLQASNTVIANQTACIDDLETSLYDFSYEISHLRIQNEFLTEENSNLRLELRSQTQRAADLRKEMLHLELETYNTKRQLDQILIARELRDRLESNLVNTNGSEIAGLMPTAAADTKENDSTVAVQEIKIDLQAIEAEMKAHEELLEAINNENQKTIAAIAANEAKIQFNIDVEPGSDLDLPFTDPLVNDSALFPESTDAPRLFTKLTLDNDKDIAAVDMENDFSSKSPIISLVENTNVVYNYIACRSDRYGKKIKKLRNNGKNWKYTFLQFNLEAENINLLLNKQFRMRVLATDLNTYLNFNTDKKVKTVSHYDFNYEGEPIKVSLFNKDIKGKSFEIQIFHIVDNKEYLLEDDQHTLFTEGVSVIGKMTLNN